jgi:hypothetical protein
MDPDSNKYHDKAAQCLQMAETAKSESERASWLKIAESWLRLMRWKDYRTSPEHPEVFVLNNTDKANGHAEPSVQGQLVGDPEIIGVTISEPM